MRLLSFIFYLFFFNQVLWAQASIDKTFKIEDLDKLPCKREVKNQFKQWNDVGRKWVAHPSESGPLIYFKPTSSMSIWIGALEREGKLIISRNTP